MKETLFVQMKRIVIQGLMCAPFTAAQDSIDTYTYLLKNQSPNKYVTEGIGLPTWSPRGLQMLH